MVSLYVAKTAANNVAELTLERSPARLFKFLTAVNGSAAISKQLAAKVRFTAEREAEGWALLTGLRNASVVATPEAESPAVEAMAACESWQSTGLVQARTILEMTSPAQALFLFHDITPGKGMASVFNAETFVLRIDQLARGPERRATRKADARALQILSEIGITKKTIEELQVTVNRAQSPRASLLADPADTDVQAARVEALRKIYAWVNTWTEIARTVIKRRDQMIQLGIAKRRPKPAVAAPVVAPPVVTAPTAPATVDHGPDSRAA